MNKDLLDVELLDRVQYSIEENICSYEIEEIEDIINEDKGAVQRCITFNRGTKYDCMIISPDGLFRAAVGDDLSPELVMGVANTLIRYAKYQH